MTSSRRYRLLGSLTALWLCGVTATAQVPVLPPRGFVDVAALAARDARARRAAELRAEAERLLAAAEALPAPLAVPPPQPPPAASGATSDGVDDERAVADQLELLRKALDAQVAYNQQYGLQSRAQSLLREIVVARGAARDAWREWERQTALHQRLERINLDAQLRLEASRSPGRSLDLVRQDRALLDATVDAQAHVRRRELARETTRFTRQQVSALLESLRRAARDEERRADLTLAEREIALRREATLRRELRAQRAAALGEVRVDLDLDAWREVMTDRVATLEQRRAEQRQRAGAMAQELRQRAAALEQVGRDEAQLRVRAYLAVIASQYGVEFVTAAGDEPDVTAAVAELIDHYAADPAALAPPAGVLPPPLPPAADGAP